ncbi:MAG TPA: Sir2 family NAD-dependent protein deacetylase [Sulfurovum sp.]|jgi:NAD-dependent deacetylase|nr:MAG: NAD-dependent deacetylase [Sulfurovum sp. 35-42-20]OYY57259.1 MAG: NAD-dependent deacetylase [Sulfurovum sp. 28-43-6]OYZ25026.1 MAG: NAD-dependent deacetylase [Sulfurovum sp. 16-42-52]OYZ49387.1 MAG: NAD-dependent deacetylase [Sulfurovum sp. 24-42-9]OZA45019.1 MAG: NAD-dependent deacetylase [Sulfurovum sp. 17-42-90]OZA59753.1 MAG: NAD-dependent deacetylase [Sulfurovum sp. 39-42-12]HQR73842.1 Sir2 family NAD-dependent protein deacetylase [Sulfurovum sp.]
MKKIMILSGAGLSAESGIRTFRDHDGLWENHDVMKVCSTQGWIADRKGVTRFYNERRADIASKEPNHAHKVLSQLECEYRGRIVHLTQNIDNLMEKAGAKEVVHLHGTLTDLRCEACLETFDVGYAAQEPHMSCPHCGAKCIRHNVVMFGEAAPAYSHIYEAIRSSSLFIAIGTSGAVIDIVSIAKEFKHSVLIDPKRQETVSIYDKHTYIDQYFEHFIAKKASEAMDELLALIHAHMED